LSFGCCLQSDVNGRPWGVAQFHIDPEANVLPKQIINVLNRFVIIESFHSNCAKLFECWASGDLRNRRKIQV
jgi:hypothetical protein